MDYITHLPLYFVWGLIGIWHYAVIYVPHPTWHRLIESFVTGFIIKCGWWVAHRLLPAPRRHKRSTGTGLASASGAADFLER